MASPYEVRELVRALSCGASFAAVMLAASGCRHSATLSPLHAKTAPDPWVLTSFDPNNNPPALLWNGQIGVRIGPNANGIGPMFAVDEYDTTGEEKILPVYNPLAVTPTVEGETLDIDNAQPFVQMLDMKTGMLTNRWTSRPGPKVEVITVLIPDRPILAQKWTLHLKPHEGFSILADCSPEEVLSSEYDPKHARWRISDRGKIMTADHAAQAESLKWQFVKTGIRLNGEADASGLVRFERILTFGPSPQGAAMDAARIEAMSPKAEHRADGEFPDVPESHWAYQDNAAPLTFDTAEKLAAQTWAKRWQTDIEIVGPVEDQQAIHSFLYYLRSAISPEGEMSISPFGLSNNKYNGHVFWDADIWVFPALALVDLEGARDIAQYRLERAHLHPLRAFQDHGTHMQSTLQFPWESSVTGKETAPPAMRNEVHITGDVLWMLYQAHALGIIDTDLEAGKYVETGLRQAAANFYRSRAEVGADGDLHLRGVTSPDESRTGDDDLYTNLLAAWLIEPKPVFHVDPTTHKLVAEDSISVFLPKDQVSYVTYAGDPVRSYKQAAAVLSIYPLQDPEAERQARVMMDRFAGKVSKKGPAMSDSLHALIWARLGETEKAYDAWRRSWQDFVTGPFLLFAEKRNHKDTYFTTGAAGCLQTVLYGFLGFRIDSKKQDGAQWSVPLALGRVLSVKPNLPQSWKSVKFRNFTVLGRRYTLIATHKGVQVIQGDQ